MISYATQHFLLRNRCSCSIHHCRTTPHLQLASQVHRCDGTAQRRCRGEHWPNPICLPVNCTPLLYTSQEPTLWGSSQCLALQPSSSGPSLICTCCRLVHFCLPPAPVTTNVEWLANGVFWVANEGFILGAVLEKYWLDMCHCCYSENKFSKREQGQCFLFPPLTIIMAALRQRCCYNQGADRKNSTDAWKSKFKAPYSHSSHGYFEESEDWHSHMVQDVDLSNFCAQIVPKVYKYTQKYNIFPMSKKNIRAQEDAPTQTWCH